MSSFEENEVFVIFRIHGFYVKQSDFIFDGSKNREFVENYLQYNQWFEQGFLTGLMNQRKNNFDNLNRWTTNVDSGDNSVRSISNDQYSSYLTLDPSVIVSQNCSVEIIGSDIKITINILPNYNVHARTTIFNLKQNPRNENIFEGDYREFTNDQDVDYGLARFRLQKIVESKWYPFQSFKNTRSPLRSGLESIQRIPGQNDTQKYELHGYSNRLNDEKYYPILDSVQIAQNHINWKWHLKNTWSGYLNYTENGGWHLWLKNYFFQISTSEVVFTENSLSFECTTKTLEINNSLVQVNLERDLENPTVFNGEIRINYGDGLIKSGFIGFTIQPKDESLYFAY